MTQETFEQKEKRQEAALKQIADKLDVARTAIAEAEQIAKDNLVSFEFEIGDGYGYFDTYRRTDGSVRGQWDGWQGSSC